MRTVLAGHKAGLTESLVSSHVEKIEFSSCNSEALWRDKNIICLCFVRRCCFAWSTDQVGYVEQFTWLPCSLLQHSPLFNFQEIPSPTVACHSSAGSHAALWPHFLQLFLLPLFHPYKLPSLWQLRVFVPRSTNILFPSDSHMTCFFP